MCLANGGEVICSMPVITGRHTVNAKGNIVVKAENLTGLAFGEDMSLQRANTIICAISTIESQDEDVPFPQVPTM